MKNLITFIVLILFGSVHSQNVPAAPDQGLTTSDNTIYNTAGLEVKPEFPGGLDAFHSFVKKRLTYSGEIKGKIYVSFIVEKDGSLTDVKIIRGLNPEIDEELIKVLKKTPKWKPGMQNGKTVRTMYQLPFSIDSLATQTKN